MSLRVLTESAILNSEDVLNRSTHPKAYGRLSILYLKSENGGQIYVAAS